MWPKSQIRGLIMGSCCATRASSETGSNKNRVLCLASVSLLTSSFCNSPQFYRLYEPVLPGSLARRVGHGFGSFQHLWHGCRDEAMLGWLLSSSPRFVLGKLVSLAGRGRFFAGF